MKNIKKLILFCFAISSISLLHASYYSEDDCNDDQMTSTNTSIKSTNSSSNDISTYNNQTITGFFIEKPTLNWKTKYFHNPVIIEARIISKSYEPYRLQVIKIPQSIYFQYMPEVPEKDFIQCNGPIGKIDFE